MAVDEYKIDTELGHASINFQIMHLSNSWLVGRFNQFEGYFGYDPENLENSWVKIGINPDSIDTNLALRDKQLRGENFLDTKQFKIARFESTKIMVKDKSHVTIFGDLTLRGITKQIAIEAELIGQGPDPWGFYRAGFMGKTSILLKDFGIDYDLGPMSQQVDFTLHLEGVKN